MRLDPESDLDTKRDGPTMTSSALPMKPLNGASRDMSEERGDLKKMGHDGKIDESYLKWG